MVEGIRAFSDQKYDYYELTQDLGGIVPKGAIFVHDTDDSEVGSPAEGCLKLCWTHDGNCYHGQIGSICGGTVIFHAAFRNSNMFKKVYVSSADSKIKNIVQMLECCIENLKKCIKTELRLEDG